MEENYMFKGNLINDFIKKCNELRIKTYDIGLGNLFFHKNKLKVIDVHKWDRSYKINNSSKPKYLQIELNNTCNAKCTMCNIPNMKRIRGCMNDELFVKILEEANKLGIEYILPFLHGEPFLRNDFLDKVKMINEYVPNAKIEIFTNASKLNKNIIEKLGSIKNINRLNLSFPGGTKESYEKITGLNFIEVKENIKYAARNLNIPIKITMPICIENKDTIMDFNELWEEEAFFKNIYISTYKTYNYIGNIKNTLSSKTYEHCDRILRSMTVLYNGEVCLCCMDSEGEVILGNLINNSIHEVWNGKKATLQRNKHVISRLYNEKCRLCNQNLTIEEY